MTSEMKIAIVAAVVGGLIGILAALAGAWFQQWLTDRKERARAVERRRQEFELLRKSIKANIRINLLRRPVLEACKIAAKGDRLTHKVPFPYDLRPLQDVTRESLASLSHEAYYLLHRVASNMRELDRMIENTVAEARAVTAADADHPQAVSYAEILENMFENHLRSIDKIDLQLGEVAIELGVSAKEVEGLRRAANAEAK